MATLKRHRSSEGVSTNENLVAYNSRKIGIDIERVLSQRLLLSQSLARVEYSEVTRTQEERRQILVDNLSQLSEAFRLGRCTTHVAVSYLDRVLSTTTVHSRDLMLVAVTCLLLAVKFEEQANNRPSVEEIILTYHSKMGGKHDLDADDVLDMEKTILERLQYRLYSVTAAHYVDTFITIGYLYSPRGGDIAPTWMDEEEISLLPSELAKYAHFFVDFSLQQIIFQNLASPVLALIIVACARQAKDIHPLCPAFVEQITGLAWSDQMDTHRCELWRRYRTMYLHEEAENIRPVEANVHQPSESSCKESQKVSPDGVDDIVREQMRKKKPSNDHPVLLPLQQNKQNNNGN